jgi:hypothetical protein
MRSAGQGAQGGQEQPKVVDQMVAEMAPQQLPEEMGIGQLPAGDMNFAGGGIIAFADGGDVERYAGGGDLYRIDPRLARAAELRAIKPHARLMGVPGAVFEGGFVLSADAANTMADMTPEERAAFYENPMVGAMGGDAGLAGAIMNAPDRAPAKATSWSDIGKALSLPFRAAVGDPSLDTDRKKQKSAPAAAAAAPATQDMSQFDAATDAYMAERAAKQGATKGTTGRKGPGAPGAAPAAGKPAAVGFREQYLKDLEGMAPEKTKTLEEIRAERAALMPKEKAYAGLEAALNKETEGAVGEKQDAIWMAVTQAGLAAAAGTSTSALKNIADGFGTGLAGYKESLKEFKKADKERQKAMADIEQARRAEERGDTDAAISLREKSQDRMDKFNDRKAAGLAAITGSEISAAASKYSADTSAATARATAGAPGQQERLFSTLGGGDVLKGMKVYSENMGTESKGMEATLQAYMKNPMELKATNPQLAAQLDAILQQRMASMSVTDKPLAKVRQQP